MKKQIWTKDEQSRFMNCSGNHWKVHCLAFARVSVSFKGSKVKRQEYFRFTLLFTYHISYIILSCFFGTYEIDKRPVVFTGTLHIASPLCSFMIWLDVLGNQEFAQNMRTQPGL